MPGTAAISVLERAIVSWLRVSRMVSNQSAILAGCVFVGGFLGSWIGARLVFPGVGAASVFPPFAILTAALVLSERRHWPLMLAASSLGNLVPHLSSFA